jgi:dTDP-glucose 4,6-dehydratase
MILVTGGAGFVGLNYVIDLLQYSTVDEIVNIDALTYSVNKAFLPKTDRHVFIHGDINDKNLVNFVLKRKPTAIINFAAETHSVKFPARYMATNISGTYNLLECIKETSPDSLLVHVSNANTFGSLAVGDSPFTENSQFKPNNPYAASKASSDHIVRAWHKTYGLKTIVTHCSNNFGIFQYPDKLIPSVIYRALKEQPIKVFGQGQQIRDWIHVSDHCAAIRHIVDHGTAGESYNIGANNEIKNINLVHKICVILDELKPRANGRVYAELIDFVQDNAANDVRRAIDTTKINNLGWSPKKDFDLELKKLIKVFVDTASNRVL